MASSITFITPYREIFLASYLILTGMCPWTGYGFQGLESSTEYTFYYLASSTGCPWVWRLAMSCLHFGTKNLFPKNLRLIPWCWSWKKINSVRKTKIIRACGHLSGKASHSFKKATNGAVLFLWDTARTMVHSRRRKTRKKEKEKEKRDNKTRKYRRIYNVSYHNKRL